MLAGDDVKHSLLRIARSMVTYHVSVCGGYLLLAIALTYPVAFHLTTRIPIAHQIPGWVPGDGDPWHSLWVLWFTQHSLVDLGRLPLFSDALFYPRGADLGYISLIGFPLLLSLPLAQLAGVVAAYNLLILFSLTAAGYATFLLVQYLTKDGRVAFVSGMIFAFCPYHLTRLLEHLFLVVSAACLPLFVLFLTKALRAGGTTNVLLASAVFLMTVLSNPYYVIFLILFAGIYVVVHLRRSRHPASRMAFTKRVALVAALTCVLSLPIVAHTLRTEWPDIVLSTSLAEVNQWSADLLAFFLPSLYHALWGSLVEPIYAHFTGNVFEQTVYIGYVVLAVAMFAVVKVQQEETRFWALCAIIFFVLALGPFLHIKGKDLFSLGDTTFYIPLPHLLFGFIPVFKGAEGRQPFRCDADVVPGGARRLRS